MTRDPPSISVLCVDDEPGMAELIGTHLERADDRLSVSMATSAGDAVEGFAIDEFDCIVSDYDMPNVDGLQFLETIRSDHPDLPFILFTGRGSEEIASDAISAGVTDYLQKESGSDQYAILANRIENVVDSRRGERQRQRQLDAIETAQEGISTLDETGRFIFVNEAYADLYGYEPSEMVGEHWELTYRDRDVQEMREVTIPHVMRTGYWHGRTVGLRADGSTFLEDHVLAKTADGKLVCTVRDATDRRKREQVIEALHTTAGSILGADTAEDVAETVVAAVGETLDLPMNGVWLYDERDGVLVPTAWTNNAEAVVGSHPTFGPGDGLAWEAFESGDGHHYADVSERRDLHNPETNIRSEIVCPIGEYGVILIGSTVVDAFDDIDVALAETVATYAETALERIAREKELRRYETVVQSMADAVYTLDEDGRIDFVNDRYVELKEVDRQELLGTEIGRWVDDETLARSAKLYEEARRGERELVKIEYEFRTGDGARIPVELRFTTIPTTDGDPGRVGVIRDVTERVERERELERQNDRLSAFASIVSHDLRNPLSVAEGRLEMAREECDSEHLDTVADALDRSQTLITDVLTMARSGERVSEPEWVDLATLAADSWSHVQTSTATLVSNTSRTVRADDRRLEQLFENLFRNAVEHGPEGVTVTVGDLANGSGFFVEDDGPGIPEDERERVFDQLYTTGEGGTGLGLSIVKAVTDAHDWHIRAAEGQDGGARFEITGVTGEETEE